MSAFNSITQIFLNWTIFLPRSIKKLTKSVINTSKDDKINAFLFAFVSIIWGLTWFTGKYQINNVILPEFAACYRLLCGGIVIYIFCKIIGYKTQIRFGEVKSIASYSFFAFSLNFILFYYAAKYIITGFSAIIYSFSIIMNILLCRYFFGTIKKIDPRVILSFFIGLTGLVLIMSTTFTLKDLNTTVVRGMVLGILATLFLCFGLTKREQEDNTRLNIFVVFFYSSFLGSFWCFLIGILHCLVDNTPIILMPELNFGFVSTFLFLGFVANAMGYLAMFTLVKRIGSVKTAYVSLASPVVALGISSVLEGYHFTFISILGMSFILLSKLITIKKSNL